MFVPRLRLEASFAALVMLLFRPLRPAFINPHETGIPYAASDAPAAFAIAAASLFIGVGLTALLSYRRCEYPPRS